MRKFDEWLKEREMYNEALGDDPMRDADTAYMTSLQNKSQLTNADKKFIARFKVQNTDEVRVALANWKRRDNPNKHKEEEDWNKGVSSAYEQMPNKENFVQLIITFLQEYKSKHPSRPISIPQLYDEMKKFNHSLTIPQIQGALVNLFKQKKIIPGEWTLGTSIMERPEFAILYGGEIRWWIEVY